MMWDEITRSAIAKIVALGMALGWNQPLGCYQLSGLAVSPYHHAGQDPALQTDIHESQLHIDMTVAALVARRIRIYGCDPVLERAVRIAKSFPQEFRPEVAMGAWISSDGPANERQLDCLARVCGEGLCDLAVVGNEALLRGDVTEATLLGYIAETKRALPGLPVTTADTYGVLLGHPAVLEAVDVVMAHIHPYWDGIPIDRAVAHVHARYVELRAASPAKEVQIGESGYPSCGEPVGGAVPSESNAAVFRGQLETWSRIEGVTTYHFALFDEPWKEQHEGEAGRCWGLLEEDYTPKPGFGPLFEDEHPGDVSW